MERELLVSDVSVNTLAVEVKVIRIGNKQMTQAVFKQLEGHTLLSKGKIQGIPWGRVNFHVDCEGTSAPDLHLHVVFQRGKKLYRTHIPHPSYISRVQPGLEGCEYGLAWGDARTCARDYVYFKILHGWKPSNPGASSAELTVEGYDMGVYLGENRLNSSSFAEPLWSETAKGTVYSSLEQSLSYHNTAIADIDETRLYQRVVDAIKEAESYKEEYTRSWEQLNQLDQLFIAV